MHDLRVTKRRRIGSPTNFTRRYQRPNRVHLVAAMWRPTACRAVTVRAAVPSVKGPFARASPLRSEPEVASHGISPSDRTPTLLRSLVSREGAEMEPTDDDSIEPSALEPVDEAP